MFLWVSGLQHLCGNQKYSEHKLTCLTMSQITPDITPASVRPELPCHLIVYILLTWTFFEAHTPYLFSEYGKEIPRASCMDLGKCLEMLGKDQGKEPPWSGRKLETTRAAVVTFGNNRKRPKGPRGHEGISPKGEPENSLPSWDSTHGTPLANTSLQRTSPWEVHCTFAGQSRG